MSNMGEIDYKISVMQAFKEGKAIERKEYGFTEWKEDFEPSWDWIDFDYRVKICPDYRPYNSKVEFLNAQKQHGIYILKKNGEYLIPTSVINGGVEFTQLGESVSYGWELLFENFCWQDGTPCGILKEK